MIYHLCVSKTVGLYQSIPYVTIVMHENHFIYVKASSLEILFCMFLFYSSMWFLI